LTPYPCIWDNKVKNKVTSPVLTTEEFQEERTPDEVLEYAYLELQKTLAQELLFQIKQCTSRFFERLVVDLLVAMGYGGTIKDAAQVVGGSRDGGIDGIIKEDRLGLDTIYIQAKRWNEKSTIARPEIQKFVGALQGRHASKGVFITTGKFSESAKDYVKSLPCKVVLIDGEQLAKYMIDFNVGVALRETYQVKRLDTDYFIEE
jgi:restriction system protein